MPSNSIRRRIAARLLVALAQTVRRLGPRGGARLRRVALPLLDPLIARVWRSVLRDKTGAQSEFVGAVAADRIHVDVGAVEAALQDAGFEINPLATLKYREYDGGREYERLSWRLVYDDDGVERQLHVYGFPSASADAVLDLYAHDEDSWSSQPWGHLDAGDQRDGDPDGRLRQALAEAGIDVTR